MSNTIDQRVVEMRFDNSHFEQNVSTTMSTLEKLKQKLNLPGASKGLENINAAAKGVDISSVGDGAEAVRLKFSGLEVFAVTAFSRISNAALTYGKNIVKALTIDPIKSGFNEYELKMGSIQTIMAGTGESLDRVNFKLNELNEYSDQTIYSFKDMTDNIGKFTNAGISLDDAVAAIKGISNAAALSGANTNEASRAMYNFSQALSSGYVQLTDWRSIELANMATSEFRQQLIDAAVATGSLKKESEGLYKTLDGTEVTVTNFRTTLQDKWLTSDALVKALNQYADGTTEIGARATAAATEVKTFSMMMDTLKESAQSGWAQTWEALVGDFEEAKSLFTDLSNLFGDIIGKSAERRNGLLSDTLDSNYDRLITKINEAGVETERFEEALSKVVGKTKFDKLIDEFGSLENVIRDGKVSSDDIKNALSGIGETSEKVVSGLSKIKETLKFGSTGDDVKEAQQALIDLGYNLDKYGADGKFKWETMLAVKDFQKAHGLLHDGILGPETLEALKEAAGTTEELTKENGKLIDSYDDLVDAITKKSGRELLLESLMNVIHAIHRPLAVLGEAFRDVFSISSDQLYNALEALHDITGKFVMKGFLDVDNWDALYKTVKKLGINWADFQVALKKTLKDHGVDIDELEKKYGNIAKAFDEGAISMDMVKETLLGFDGITESLLLGGDAAEKLRRTLKGVFSLFKIFSTIAGGVFKLAFKTFSTLLGKFDMGILDFTAMVGDALTGISDFISGVIDSGISSLVDLLVPKIETACKAMSDWAKSIRESETGKKIIDSFKNWPATLDAISQSFGNGITKISGWIGALKETPIFQTVSGWLSEAGETITNALTDISKGIENFSMSGLAENLQEFGSFLSTVAGSLANSELFVTIVDAICAGFAKLKEFVGKFKLPEFNLANLTQWVKDFINLDSKGITNISGFFTGLKELTLEKFKFKFDTWVNKGIQKFAEFWIAWGEKVRIAFDKCKGMASALKEFIFGSEDVNLPDILAVAEKFLGIVVLFQVLKTLETFASPFDNISDALNNVAAGFKWDAIAAGFKAMALALAAFALCIYVIGTMDDIGKAWQAAGMLALLMVTMGGIVAGIAFAASKIDGGLNAAAAAGSLLMIIASIVLMVKAIKEIDEFDMKDPVGTIGILITTLLALSAGVRIIAKAGGSSFKGVAAILTLVTALNMLLGVIEAYDAFDWTGKSAAIWHMVDMLMVLSLAINIASAGIKAGSSASGLAMLMIAMVVSLKILLGVIEDFANTPTDVLTKGIGVVAILLAGMTAMAFALGKASGGTVLEKGQKSVNNFTGLAFALLAVVAAVYLLGKMGDETLIKGGIAVASALILFTGMLSVLGKSCSGLKISSLITMMIAIGLLLAETAVIMHIMKDNPWEQTLSSAGALAGVLLAIAAVLKVLSGTTVNVTDIFVWIGAMAGMALVLYALGDVVTKMKEVAPANAIANAVALSGLMAAMAGVIYAMNKFPIDPNVTKTWIYAMGGMVIVLGLLATIVWCLKDVDPENSIGNAMALGLLITAMAGVLEILTKHRNRPETITKWVLALAGVWAVVVLLAVVLDAMEGIEPKSAIANATALSALLIAMAGVLVILNKFKVNLASVDAILALAAMWLPLMLMVDLLARMQGVENATSNAMALSILAGALSVCMVLLGVASKLAGGSLITGAVSLAIVAAMLAAVVAGLAEITGIETARANAITLANLAVVLTACVTVLSVVGLLVPGVIAGTAALVILAVTLGALVWGLSAIDNVETARANAVTMIMLLSSLTSVVMMLGSLGAGSIVAVAALNGLINLVAKLGVMATAVGMLTEVMPGIESFIDNGLDIFIKLASGLGKMVSEFGVGLTSGLPEIGSNLSAFVEAAGPFISLVKGVGDDVGTGTENLVGAIMGLLGADFIAGLAELLGLSLVDLAWELSDFATEIQPFLTAMQGISPEMVTSITTMCEGLNALTAASFWGNLGDLIFGDGSLSTFGETVSEFATCIKDAAGSLSGITDADVENIKRSATAGQALADLNKAIPSQGGWLQDFIGSKELDKFGESIIAFADCLVSYSQKVSGKNIDAAAITASANAATALSDLNNALPKQGGWAQNVMGSQELTTFGESIVAFADCLISYSQKVSGQTIDSTAITQSASAAEALATLNGKLPSQNGLWQAVAGEQNMGEFGTRLVAFADGIVAYANAAAQLDESKITAIENSGKAIDKLVAVSKKVPDSGGWGDAIFGSSDMSGFGTGLTSMANGIVNYCNTAISIDESKLTAIDNSMKAVEKLSGLSEIMPDVSFQTDSYNTLNAIKNFALIATELNTITASAYDYSGIDSLKTTISDITTMFTDVDTGALSVNFSVVKTAIGDAATCASKIAALKAYDYSGVDKFKSALESLAGADVQGVIDAFSGKSSAMAGAMQGLVNAMADGISSYSGKVSNAMASVVGDMADTAGKKKGEFKNVGMDYGDNLVKGINSKKSQAKSAGTSIGGEAVTGAESKYSSMSSAGAYLVDGFAEGITENTFKAEAEAAAMAEKAINAAREKLKVNSPSKVFREIGYSVPEGFAMGIDRLSSMATESADNMAGATIRSVSQSISKISDVINSDIDAQPTIRPVLDLSDVRAGAGAINGMLNSNPISLMTNVGAASTMMHRRGQNGAESEVVSAINKLRRDISSMPRESYQINGVTYDDGSNIKSFAEAIVHQAKLERRV